MIETRVQFDVSFCEFHGVPQSAEAKKQILHDISSPPSTIALIQSRCLIYGEVTVDTDCTTTPLTRVITVSVNWFPKKEINEMKSTAVINIQSFAVLPPARREEKI